jgi:hypothetical protein
MGDQGLYRQREMHPIHFVDWTASPKLKISLVNLVGQFGGRPLDVKADATYGKEEHVAWFDFEYPTRSAETWRRQVKEFFDAVKAHGWEVEDAIYDHHYTYPASQTEYCSNKEICILVQEISESIRRHARPEEVVWDGCVG